MTTSLALSILALQSHRHEQTLFLDTDGTAFGTFPYKDEKTRNEKKGHSSRLHFPRKNATTYERPPWILCIGVETKQEESTERRGGGLEEPDGADCSSSDGQSTEHRGFFRHHLACRFWPADGGWFLCCPPQQVNNRVKRQSLLGSKN